MEMSDKRIWRQHGYLFFALYGAGFGALLIGSFKVLGVPTDVPLRDVWGWDQFGLWLVYVAFASVVAYAFAPLASALLKRLLGLK